VLAARTAGPVKNLNKVLIAETLHGGEFHAEFELSQGL
jgi:hypothetical protein